MARHSPLATPWQKARVRAAILGRYWWDNWAALVELATWIMLFLAGLAGAELYAMDVTPAFTCWTGITVSVLAFMMVLDALRYQWREAIMDELYALDQAMKHVLQAGEQPDAR